jgi:hypothetical protein
MPRVTIHQRLEICHLGMQFVHNWLRKRSYALCKSCRGMPDLQLSYSNFCALHLKFLEKNRRQRRQAELVLTIGALESPGPTEPTHRGRPRSVGLRTVGPPCAAPPSSPTPLVPRAGLAVATTRRPRRPTTGITAVPASRCHLSMPMPWPSWRLDVHAPPPCSDHLFKHRTVHSRVHQGRRRRHVCRPRGAPPSGRRRRQTVLLLPPLGPPLAATLACCLGQAAGSSESNQNLHKVIEGIFLYQLSCDIDKSS